MFRTLALGTAAMITLAVATALFTVNYQVQYDLPVDLVRAGHHSLVALVLGFSVLGLLALGIRKAVQVGVCFLLLAIATLSFGSISAFAQDVAANDGSKLTFSYGSFIMQYGLELAGWAVTLLAGVISTAIGIYVPMAKSVVTQTRLEQAGQALLQYGINAVPNSIKDGKVTVNLGSEVVATAVARGMNVLPAKVIKAAGGGGGLAAIIFRMMNLEDGASKSTVLDPALAKLTADGHV